MIMLLALKMVGGVYKVLPPDIFFITFTLHMAKWVLYWILSKTFNIEVEVGWWGEVDFAFSFGIQISPVILSK